MFDQGLKKLNPRENLEEPNLPTRLQKFLNQKFNKKPSISKEKTQKTLNSHLKKPVSNQKPKISLSLYQKQLEFSRSYSKYIQEYDQGKQRDDIFPENIPKKASFSSLKANEEKDPEDGKALFENLTKKKVSTDPKKLKLKGKGLLQGPSI